MVRLPWDRKKGIKITTTLTSQVSKLSGWDKIFSQFPFIPNVHYLFYSISVLFRFIPLLFTYCIYNCQISPHSICSVSSTTLLFILWVLYSVSSTTLLFILALFYSVTSTTIIYSKSILFCQMSTSPRTEPPLYCHTALELINMEHVMLRSHQAKPPLKRICRQYSSMVKYFTGHVDKKKTSLTTSMVWAPVPSRWKLP